MSKPEKVLGDVIQNAAQGYEAVISPPHYNQGPIECIDALRSCLTPEEFRGFLKGNVIKYNWRLGHKGKAKEDAEKARWYLDKLIGELAERHR
ncbi:MAG: DUF3310 domain-containing protein [Desulfurellales bacterium]|nr:MAG: DUF3310 domain-containing protein [Desulfurellales bacterium]